jgi:hypothetical protein
MTKIKLVAVTKEGILAFFAPTSPKVIMGCPLKINLHCLFNLEITCPYLVVCELSCLIMVNRVSSCQVAGRNHPSDLSVKLVLWMIKIPGLIFIVITPFEH